MRLIKIIYIFAISVLVGCGDSTVRKFEANDPGIRYAGRMDFTNEMEPLLISSASYVEFNFEGKSCEVWLRKLNPPGEHNYVSVEIDGEYLDRIKIVSDTLMPFKFSVDNEGPHSVRIFKATEAHSNHIAFGGVITNKLLALDPLPARKIEFIGNSITCAAASDLSQVPCGAGFYHDQHNAYLSYATQSAMKLDAQFLLSSVSGIGIYRNWNSLGPVISDVYENLYLNTDSTKRYDFNSYTPDLVSIGLGTNDMSRGDGKSERLPFDSVVYVQSYLRFIDLIFSRYPETQICVLSSPMMGGEDRVLLGNCLEAVVRNSNAKYSEKKPIRFFDLKIDTPAAGCTTHPSVDDHILMTERVVPFYREIMGW